jgi:hypothetical protein
MQSKLGLMLGCCEHDMRFGRHWLCWSASNANVRDDKINQRSLGEFETSTGKLF